ncbi:uncharacterized protein B0H18DRAFT_1118153 [Fomitopsis serialis]|uniref:uncharacterized protein n=1 Tax=Fomitopsis serialis TaxID=139415 RepID=UPI0020081E21|nr:uncharacterized protein B0H18DRAFT_1118153 [Neoantrodia serialis]KAH9928134.1 hypothetical protein B0H18DRAFT_1118153 [Neoantrodia serialis]
MTSEDPDHLQHEVCSKLQAFKLNLEEVLSYLSKALCPTHGARLPHKEPYVLLCLQQAFYALTDSIRRTVKWAFQQWGATPESNAPVSPTGIPLQAKRAAGTQSAVAQDDQGAQPSCDSAMTAFVELSNTLVDYGPSQIGSVESGSSDSVSAGLGNRRTHSGEGTVDEDGSERNAGADRDPADCAQGDQDTAPQDNVVGDPGSHDPAEHLRSLVSSGRKLLMSIRQETELLLAEGYAYSVHLKRSVGIPRISALTWFKIHLVVPRRVLTSVFLATMLLAVVMRTFRHILAVWMEEEDFFDDDDYF